MPEYRVIAANQEPCQRDANFIHVTAIETGTGPLDNEVWTASEACRAIGHGDRFILASPDIRQTVALQCVVCPGCKETRTLESRASLAALDIHKLPPLR